MALVLGVEGDGAHTHAVLTDSSGTLLGFGVNDDSSDWDSVGIAAAAAALRSCITEALHSAQAEGDAVGSAVFGLAGVDFPVDERRLGGIPEAIGFKGKYRIMNDSFAAMRAGTDDPFGVVIVAGNGSVVAGRNAEGIEYRSLGLGRLYGDFGSETDISESALTAVAEAFIGLGPPTSLTTMLCEFAGVESVVDLVDGTARGRIDTTLFTPVVIAAAADGDLVARGLLSHAGAMLGATAVHVIRTLRMEHTSIRPRARAPPVRQRRTRGGRGVVRASDRARRPRDAARRPARDRCGAARGGTGGCHPFERRAFDAGRRVGSGARRPLTE